MARREDQHRHHHQLHYASILPSNTNEYRNHNDPRFARRFSEHERSKALYIDVEDAFQDEEINNDYFGFQFREVNSHPSTNDQLQSVQTISEVQNSSFSPYVRYQVPRETSQPFDQLRYNHRSNPSPSHLNRDFTNLNLRSSNERHNDISAPDAIRSKVKQEEIIPHSSSQSKLSLPQYFLVKYLGRTSCAQLWGANAVRIPIDEMVRDARQLSSMNEIPTLEACVNSRGLTLEYRHSSTHNHNPERHQQGLIPLDNISYAMHDVKYSKIASCIVLRQLKTSSNDQRNTGETLTECYAFLFQSKEHAHRFARALAEAFSTQHQSTRTSREGRRSPTRRSKHRSSHHRTRTEGKSNDHHLRDSKA